MILQVFIALTVVASLTEAVSFSANSPYNKRDVFGGPHFLAFDNVITDSDSAFDDEYGAFRAPQTGYYAFHLCMANSGRGGRSYMKIGLYTYSVSSGRRRILSIRSNKGKCYSTVVYMRSGSFAYNVIESGRLSGQSEENMFTGYLLGGGSGSVKPRPHVASDDTGSRRGPSKFPASAALPASSEGSSHAGGDADDLPPFLKAKH